MTNNKPLQIIQKYSAPFNLVLGIGLWALVKFALSLIIKDNTLGQNILLSCCYFAFLVFYIFIIKKIGTIQLAGFQTKNFFKTTIFLIPVIGIGILTSVFVLTAVSRTGLKYSLEELTNNLPILITAFFETIFLHEVFTVGFLSALHHRYSKTQWRVVIFCLIEATLLCFFQCVFGGETEVKQILFQLFVNVLLALIWIKYRNQIVFLVYYFAVNAYTILLSSLNATNLYVIVSDEKFVSQINMIVWIGVGLFAAFAIFMILTLKFPIPKKKVVYYKEIEDSNETKVEVETVLVTKKDSQEK